MLRVRMLKKGPILLLFLTLLAIKSNGQDAVFSQYFASGIYFNPALSATETSVSVSAITRTQWKGTSTPYQTSMIALTVPIKDKFEKHKRLGAISLSIYDDKLNDNTLRTTGVNAVGSYGLNLTKKDFLFFGVMAGYYQRTIDEENFQWGSQYDPAVGWDPSTAPGIENNISKASYFDLNAGVLMVHELGKDVGTDRSGIFLGVSTYHLTQPNESLIEGQSSELPLRLNANIGALLPLKKHIGISPNLLYVMQGASSQLNLGVYSTYYFLKNVNNGLEPNNIELGVWYRLEDSFIFNVGVGNEVYHLGFSYDLTTSNLKYSTVASTTYEVSLKLQKPHKKIERHYTPRF